MRDVVHPTPADALLDALRAFRLSGVSGASPHGVGLFSYCALARERLVEAFLPNPVLGVVLSGRKEIWRGLDQEILLPGTLFALPAGVQLDIVNEPDQRSGIYQSLILEIEPQMVSMMTSSKGATRAAKVAIPLWQELVEAISHAAAAIAAGPSADGVRRARIAELLSLLSNVPAAAVVFDLSITDRIAQMVKSKPDACWVAGEVARALGMSEATLRRRLRLAESSFTAILRRERMHVARRMLEHGMTSGMAAAAVGYASRTHFARAYRLEIGQNPCARA